LRGLYEPEEEMWEKTKNMCNQGFKRVLWDVSLLLDPPLIGYIDMVDRLG
jgi:hypothetical protein